jgi:electron transfer flavoprotein alpha subunit
MSVLVFIDHADGHIKKTSLEAISYGSALAKKTGANTIGVVLGTVTEDLTKLGKFGIEKIYHIAEDFLNQVDTDQYIEAISAIVEKTGATVLILSHNNTGRAIAPGLSIRLKAGLITGATGLPETANGFFIKKNVYSGKAFCTVSIKTAIKIISLNPNAFTVVASEGTAEIVKENLTLPPARIVFKSVSKASGEIPLTEAEIVVSGGRGMKGPENWGLIEELAKVLHAATACSRPVADAGWRPHHEHVGQTGIAIAPNLYIAIGISGAIQHLAGVNRSKVIVVINKDPEAPFFKSADYGIIGDAFEILPKIVQAAKKLKGIA